MMQAGKMRSRIKIQYLGNAQDAIGQPVSDWLDFIADTVDKKIAADIRNISGIESIKADSPASVVKASVRIRFRAGITAGMRVLNGATAYNITAVLPDTNGKKHIDLVCEVVNG